MTAVIPIRSNTLPAAELAVLLDDVAAALPEARVVSSKGATMMDPATLALFLGAGATAAAGLVTAIATVAAAHIAARKPAAAAAPPVIVIVIETNTATYRLSVDPAEPAAAAAAPLPTALSEIVALRVEA